MTKEQLQGMLAEGFNLNQIAAIHMISKTELEKAAYNFALEPTPTIALKSTGANLPAERISKLLEAWKQSRQTRGTAFLNADIEMTSVGFDPKSLQLTEARQYLATEIARLMNIPAWYVSADTNSMTYSNVTSERRALVDFDQVPQWVHWYLWKVPVVV